MPFSSLKDPADVARAQGALDVAWQYVQASILAEDRDKALTDLSCIVASLTHVALDETELVDRALTKFRENRRS